MEPSRSSVEELLETAEGRLEFAKEELALEATETISELMQLAGVSRSELAKRTGNSKAYITQVLSGSRNMTIHTLASLAFGLGYRITFKAGRVDQQITVHTHAAELTLMQQPSLKPRLERADQPAPVLFRTPSPASPLLLTLRAAA